MGFTYKELNQTNLLDFLKSTRIHFGIGSSGKIETPEVRPANQNDINSLLS